MLDFTVDGLTISLVLLAALLHASWNALTKAGGDPLISITIISATGGVCAIPLLLLSPLPDAETWRWLLVSACIHYVYQLSLVRIYRLGDLSQVYPIARGLAPLGVATLAAIGAGERLQPGQLAGLACASIAIVSLGTACYAIAGGIRAVVWTDVLQAVVAVVVGLVGLVVLLEALDWSHNGRNEGAEPVRILAISLGSPEVTSRTRGEKPLH